ncbi:MULTISPECIES: hypothetical protein [Methylopilaceae]|uniref:Helix-turn-helix domain-containing protein n=2 Tax=Methylopilaceae TaxID=3149309 RepID=A0A4Q0M9U3_9HYPH|nr:MULTISPECIES: hypothetical protein [Methylocystaceae]QZO00541.1 hypothetical protein K6K41_02075 [Chenggangzhangella methanolivorans]RXF69990.1 hypothetical protein EK403_17855 [Hansschlegelia zhihuaiae]
MPKGFKISSPTHRRIVALRRAGRSRVHIAKELGVSYSMVVKTLIEAGLGSQNRLPDEPVLQEYLEAGMSQAEIARTYEVSPALVSKTLKRAREALEPAS